MVNNHLFMRPRGARHLPPLGLNDPIAVEIPLSPLPLEKEKIIIPLMWRFRSSTHVTNLTDVDGMYVSPTLSIQLWRVIYRAAHSPQLHISRTP